MAARWATVADVNDPDTGVAPSLVATTAQVELWLEITKPRVGLAVFGTQSSHYHALLVAHFLTANADGERGPVVSEAHGPASVSYATPTVDASSLSTTFYGRAALEIRKTVSPLPVRTRSGYP